MTGKLTQAQSKVLEHFKRLGPMTDERLGTMYRPVLQQSSSGLRTRRNELVQAGLLEDSGKRRHGLYSCRKAIVWQMVKK